MNRELFCDRINEYLKQQYGFKRKLCQASLLNNTIDLNRATVSLYLRYKPKFNRNHDYPWPPDCLVIAVIAFTPVRKGHGRRFIELIQAIAKDFNIKSIGLECVNPNSQSLGKAMGFSMFGANDMLKTL